MHSSNKTLHNGRIRATPSSSSPTAATTGQASNSNPNAAPAPSSLPIVRDNDNDDQERHVKTTLSGRAVTALPLHTPSTYESLVSTLSALGPLASGSTKAVGSWGRNAYEHIQFNSSRRQRVSEEGDNTDDTTQGHAPLPHPATLAPAPPDVDRIPRASSSSLPGINEGEENDNDDDNDALSQSIHHRPSKHDDPILFSTWDTTSTTRVLIQVFQSGRIKIWDTASSSSSFNESIEILNIDVRSEICHHPHHGLACYPLCARFIPSPPPLLSPPQWMGEQGHVPILAILTSDNIIHLYSMKSHNVIKRLSINAGHAGQMMMVVNFQVNERFLVAATVQPLSLHIFNLSTLEPAPFSPIMDIAPHPYDFTPVYCLSQSSRLLAYASTIAPAYGGSGIIATSSGWSNDELQHGGASVVQQQHLSNTSSSSVKGGIATSSSPSSSSSASFAVGRQSGNANSNGAAMDYGETARRWGEGMMSHMKAVTDYGYSRYYGNSSSITGLTPPSNQQSPIYNHRGSSAGIAKNIFSKSAPHPSSSSPFYSRSPHDIAAGSNASSPASASGGHSGRPNMHSPRPASGGGGLANSSSSSSVKVLDLVASIKSFDAVSSAAAASRSTSAATAAQRSRSPQYSSRAANTSSSSSPASRDDIGSTGHVVTIAHFKPSKNHALTLLSINPNGTLILTSSSEGHSFHVFELRPPSLVGNSSIRNISPSRSSSSTSNTTQGHISHSSNKGKRHNTSLLQVSNGDLKVWHRYRLNRGLTVAQTVSAHWSSDSRFVLVSTKNKGTVHVYPILPLGGKATPETHLSENIQNEQTLARLSVTVHAIARIKAPKLPSSSSSSHAAKEEKMGIDGVGRENTTTATGNNTAAMMTSPPDMLFVPSELLPMHAPLGSRSRQATTTPNSRTVSLVLFYPHLHSILQTNLHLSSSPRTAPSDAPLSTRVTSQAVSGLTQMMKNRGSALPTFESEVLLATLEWISQWPLAVVGDGAIAEEDDIRVDLSTFTTIKDSGNNTTEGAQRKRITSAHEAELESFSHAPAVLPRSIYLAQTLTFHTYPPEIMSKQGIGNVGLIQQFSFGNYTISKASKVIVREEVSHRFGSSSYATGGRNEPFDESTELHSAMHTILDAADFSSSHGEGHTSSGAHIGYGYSPNSHSPAFPNGYGKTSSSSKWLPSPATLVSTLPIPIGISPQSVRQAADKVRKYSSSIRSPRLNATSPAAAASGSAGTSGGAGAGGHTLQGSTLSFEDDDAVLAQIPPEMLEIDEEGIDLGRRPPYHSHSARQQYIPPPRAVNVPSSSSLRTDKYGSPSPAPLPSLSAGTASSAESQAGSKSTTADSPDILHPHSRREPGSPAIQGSTIADEESRNEGEWDSFKLEGIDDEDDLLLSNISPPLQTVYKQKLPSPLLSHAMLPILAAKSEQQAASGAQRGATKDVLVNAQPGSEGDRKPLLAVPGAASNTAASAITVAPSVGTALEMAYKPLEPKLEANTAPAEEEEVPLISPTLMTHQELSSATTPSPLSSSPAVSSAAEFSASPATAAVLASKRNGKKKSKKGKA